MCIRGQKLPWDIGFDDRIGDCDQLSCNCDGDDFVGLSAFVLTFCDRFEGWVMASSGYKNGVFNKLILFMKILDQP